MKLSEKNSKPLQIVLSVFIVAALIKIGEAGYDFGIWLKDIF